MADSGWQLLSAGWLRLGQLQAPLLTSISLGQCLSLLAFLLAHFSVSLLASASLGQRLSASTNFGQYHLSLPVAWGRSRQRGE